MFDGVEDVPSSSSITENSSDDSSSSGSSNSSSKNITAGAAAVGRGTNRLLQRSNSTRAMPTRYVAPSARVLPLANAPLTNSGSSHTNHSGGGGDARCASVGGLFASNVPSLPPPPPPVVHPVLARAYHHQYERVYPSPHPRRSVHHAHRSDAFSSGGVAVESMSTSDVVGAGGGSFRRGSDPGPESFDHHHSGVAPGAAAPQRPCGLSSPLMHPQHQHTPRHPVYQSRRQTVWPVSGSASSIDQYSNVEGNCSSGGSMHPGQHVRSRMASYEAAPSANRIDCTSHGRLPQHHRHPQHHHQEMMYSECEGGWRGDGAEAEAENWAYHRRGQLLPRAASVRSMVDANDPYNREELHHDSYDADTSRGYSAVSGETDESRTAYVTCGGSAFGDGGGSGRSVEHDYEYEVAVRQRQVRQMCGNPPVAERPSFPAASRGAGRVSMRGW